MCGGDLSNAVEIESICAIQEDAPKVCVWAECRVLDCFSPAGVAGWKINFRQVQYSKNHALFRQETCACAWHVVRGHRTLSTRKCRPMAVRTFCGDPDTPEQSFPLAPARCTSENTPSAAFISLHLTRSAAFLAQRGCRRLLWSTPKDLPTPCGVFFSPSKCSFHHLLMRRPRGPDRCGCGRAGGLQICYPSISGVRKNILYESL